MVRILLLLTLAACAVAQTHPRMMLTPSILTTLRARAAANTTEWKQLIGMPGTPDLIQQPSCAYLTWPTPGFGFPDDMPPILYPGEARPAGYYGIYVNEYTYYSALANLSLCYQIEKTTNPTNAAKYAAQGKRILAALTAPFATVTYGATSRAIASVSREAVTNAAVINLPYHNYAAGTQVTISGVLGCTEANATVLVSSPATKTFKITTLAAAPIICATSAGTNQNQNFLRDDGYDMRTSGPALAIGYDWLYDELDTTLKNRIYATMNAWVSEYVALGANSPVPGNMVAPHSNYHTGFMAGVGMIGIASRGENSRGQEWYDLWRDMHLERDAPFYQRWLKNNSGMHESWQYGRHSVINMLLPLYANLTANSEDLMTEAIFEWAAGVVVNYIHTTMPDMRHMIERGYTSSDGVSYDVNKWSEASMVVAHHIAVALGSSKAQAFKGYVDELHGIHWNSTLGSNQKAEAQAGALWQRFLFWDSGASSADWRTEPLSLAMMSNPAGGYGRVVMRSAWETTAVIGDFLASPYTSDITNAKERHDKGSLLVARGDGSTNNVHLLINPQGEASRALNTAAADVFFNGGSGESRLANSIYYADRTGYTSRQLGTTAHPGWQSPTHDGAIASTSFPTRIDLYQEGTSFVYSRAVSLESMYAYNDPTYSYQPVKGWTREVMYIRPKVFVVFDRTQKQNKTSAPTQNYTQFLGWMVGKTPSAAEGMPSGVTRYNVADGATFKGAVTSLLPANTASVINWGNYNLAYQIVVRPETDAEYTNWLTVIDAASSESEVAAATTLTATNASAAQIGGAAVVVFAHGSTPTLPITYTFDNSVSTKHYIAGLTPSTTYTVVVSGTSVTISTFDGTADETTSTSGVIMLDLGVQPPVVTTIALAGGTVGTAYSETLAVSGGESPYSWSVVSGSLCAGLTLSSAGVLSGTPTTAETCPFTVRVTDSVDDYDDQELSIVVAPAPTSGLVVNVTNVIPGTTSALVRYTITGPAGPVTCLLTTYLVDSGLVVSSATDSGGAATRQLSVSGLTADTEYTARVKCDDAETHYIPFVTLPESVATAGVVVSLKPPGSLGEVIGKLKVEYGPAFGDSVTDAVADAGGRYSVTIPAQTVGSIVQYRWQWLTAADVAVTGVSKTRFAVVK